MATLGGSSQRIIVIKINIQDLKLMAIFFQSKNLIQ
jgi:hypothetical protein